MTCNNNTISLIKGNSKVNLKAKPKQFLKECPRDNLRLSLLVNSTQNNNKINNLQASKYTKTLRTNSNSEIKTGKLNRINNIHSKVHKMESMDNKYNRINKMECRTRSINKTCKELCNQIKTLKIKHKIKILSSLINRTSLIVKVASRGNKDSKISNLESINIRVNLIIKIYRVVTPSSSIWEGTHSRIITKTIRYHKVDIMLHKILNHHMVIKIIWIIVLTKIHFLHQVTTTHFLLVKKCLKLVAALHLKNMDQQNKKL